ncbi:MAG: hypothetical protein JWO22_333 [Frankiales bacterium]|nr:hypothetical protein [Frankiales bacterium]
MRSVRHLARIATVLATLAAVLALSAPAQADPVSDLARAVASIPGVPACC